MRELLSGCPPSHISRPGTQVCAWGSSSRRGPSSDSLVMPALFNSVCLSCSRRSSKSPKGICQTLSLNGLCTRRDGSGVGHFLHTPHRIHSWGIQSAISGAESWIFLSILAKEEYSLQRTPQQGFHPLLPPPNDTVGLGWPDSLVPATSKPAYSLWLKPPRKLSPLPCLLSVCPLQGQ